VVIDRSAEAGEDPDYLLRVEDSASDTAVYR